MAVLRFCFLLPLTRALHADWDRVRIVSYDDCTNCTLAYTRYLVKNHSTLFTSLVQFRGYAGQLIVQYYNQYAPCSKHCTRRLMRWALKTSSVRP